MNKTTLSNDNIIKGVGHYSMLESPKEFNLALQHILRDLS